MPTLQVLSLNRKIFFFTGEHDSRKAPRAFSDAFGLSEITAVPTNRNEKTFPLAGCEASFLEVRGDNVSLVVELLLGR